MDNELKNTEETTEKTTNQNSESDTIDLKELQLKVKALEAENGKLKQSVTNASADASKYKKELQARMTEDEKAKADQEAANAKMLEELEMLRNERNVANHKAELTDIGFSNEIAQETAEAINKGDTAKLFAGIRKFIESHDKELHAKSLMSNPVISGGDVKKSMTKKEFDELGYTERVKLYNENPELYKEMTK